MVKRKEIVNNQSGFTLLEVMIAIAIFTIFATVFITGQGYNVLDSSKLKTEINLKDLCENKINDIITSPPELKDSLTLSKEVKDSENDSNYKYSIEYKKFIVPDMSKLKNTADEDDDAKAQTDMEKRIWNTFKENMEKIIWQVEVVCTDKVSNDQFRVSTWLYNNNAEVKVSGF